MNSTEKVCIILSYEKLPNFCFICGILGHVQRDCDRQKGEENSSKLGNWLRASSGLGDRKNDISKRPSLYLSDSSSGPSIEADGLNDEEVLARRPKNTIVSNSSRDKRVMDEHVKITDVIPKRVDHSTEMGPSASEMELTIGGENALELETVGDPTSINKKWKHLAKDKMKDLMGNSDMDRSLNLSKRSLSFEDNQYTVTKRAKPIQANDEEGAWKRRWLWYSPAEQYELLGMECTRAWEPPCNP